MKRELEFHDVTCGDMFEYGGLLAGPWELEYRQLSPGKVSAGNRGVRIGSSIAYEESFDQSVSVLGALGPELVGFSFPNRLAETRGRWWGHDHPGSAISFANANGEIDVTFPGGYRNILVLIEKQAFLRQYRNYSGQDAHFLNSKSHHLSIHPDLLQNCTDTLYDLISKRRTLLYGKDPIAQLIVRTLVDGMPRTRNEAAVHLPYSKTRVIRKAIQTWEEADFKISMEEISHDVGVCQRTLEHIFREHMNITPYQYLKRSRLGMARDALRKAEPTLSTVTEIATRFGFYELGRFSVDYRKFFGESPSATLSTAIELESKQLFKDEENSD